MNNPHRIAIVVNPYAGSGRAVKLSTQIISALGEKDIHYQLFKTDWPADFAAFSDIWIVGGDGTLNYFINHYPHIQIPMVIFRGGSGNDFHWLLYADKSLPEMLETALHAEPRNVDAGKCNERYFMNGVGIGFEGAVAHGLKGKNKKLGKASFFIAILKKIFFFKEQEYSIASEEWKGKDHLLMISVMNGQRAGGGFHVAPEACVNDGLLDTIIVKPLSIIRRLRYLPVIEKGKHLRYSFIYYYRTKKIIVESRESLLAHLDGEFYDSRRLEIEILPDKYRFRY